MDKSSELVTATKDYVEYLCDKLMHSWDKGNHTRAIQFKADDGNLKRRAHIIFIW